MLFLCPDSYSDVLAVHVLELISQSSSTQFDTACVEKQAYSVHPPKTKI